MASNHKHSDGPWLILPDEPDRDYIRIRGTRPGLYKIANVPFQRYDDGSIAWERAVRANADLIASAPGLLETIEQLRAALLVAAERCATAGLREVTRYICGVLDKTAEGG